MRLLLLSLALAFVSACATARQETRVDEQKAATTVRPDGGTKKTAPWQEGIASYYADSLHGRRTASGQPYDRNAATCAHRTHRFGTELVVQVVETGRTVQCRVNDRGPFVKGRIVDLSRRLAEELGLLERGLVRVRIAPREALE